MTKAASRENLDEVAARVLESLDETIAIIENAAEQIASGKTQEEIDSGGLTLYMARSREDEEGRIQGVVYAMDYEDYMRLLEDTAARSGLCMEEMTELEVNLPQMEFGENLVTGGFEDFRGICVQKHNDCILDLMEAVFSLLQRRGFSLACIADEDVIFYRPLK